MFILQRRLERADVFCSYIPCLCRSSGTNGSSRVAGQKGLVKSRWSSFQVDSIAVSLNSISLVTLQ